MSSFEEFLSELNSMPHNFDLDVVMKYINENQGDAPLTLSLVRHAINACTGNNNIDFDDVTAGDITNHGILQDDLQFNVEDCRSANSGDSPASMNMHHGYHNDFRIHFNVTQTFGSRGLVDQYLLYATKYAQGLIDNDLELRGQVSSFSRLTQPHLAVFQDVIIDPEHRLKFSGKLDYALCIVSAQDRDWLCEGVVPRDPANVLCTVLYCPRNSMERQFQPRLMAQITSLLELTGRRAFFGALTNGPFWRFFVARHIDDGQVKIASSGTIMTSDNKGAIIEILKDMMVSDGVPESYKIGAWSSSDIWL